MKRQITFVLILVAVAGSGAVAAWRQVHVVQNPAAQSSQPQSQAHKVLDPLAIEAICARTYAPSSIAEVRSAGQQGGYKTDVVQFRSDGLAQYALQATPSTLPPAGGYPVIILMHGYIPPAQYKTDDGGYRDWIAAWAKAGFVVIKPDYRGNGTSEGSPEGGHFSPAYTYDMLNLVASLKRYNLVNGSRIGIAGHSMGGHVALRTADCSPDVKATALANGVVGSMYDLFFNWPHSPAPNDQPTAVVRGHLQELVDKQGNPKTNPDFWNQASAINYVDRIKGPVQINHDVGDSTVPVLFSEHLNDALKKAGKAPALYEYPGDDHQYTNPSNHTLLIQRTTEFFKQNL